MRDTYNFNSILLNAKDAAAIEIIRDNFKSRKIYIFHKVNRLEQGSLTNTRLKVKKFLKRTDFLHKVLVNVIETKNNIIFLNSKNC